MNQEILMPENKGRGFCVHIVNILRRDQIEAMLNKVYQTATKYIKQILELKRDNNFTERRTLGIALDTKVYLHWFRFSHTVLLCALCLCPLDLVGVPVGKETNLLFSQK